MKIDFTKFIKLRDDYLKLIDKTVELADGYCKGRDWVVNISWIYARESSLFVSKTNKWHLDIPSYQFDSIDMCFVNFKSLVIFFENHIKDCKRKLEESDER